LIAHLCNYCADVYSFRPGVVKEVKAVPEATEGGGRERQRRRTRKAILDAAVELLGREEEP